MSARIMLVEDEPANIRCISAILQEEGHKVSVATGGQQALELLNRVRPDLILLDVLMPGIDGFETCRHLKANPLWRDIPTIFLTSKTEPADIIRGFEAGAVDYVGKPFNSHELLARVRTHLALDQLHRENQRLLLNILPAPIAERLKKETGLIAERFDDVSVLFADLVGFTQLSTTLSPSELLALLNQVFSAFDELADVYGLEKIKTIGDAYMVGGGIPDPHPGHLDAMARLALAMQEHVCQISVASGTLNLRVGLHSGSVIAGVIGIRKFIYDIWGDTVNTASRLESQGVEGRVQVSESVFERLRDRFQFEHRGHIELKGRGLMNTYFLLSPK